MRYLKKTSYLCKSNNSDMLEEYINKIINGDCLEVLRKLPDESIDIWN